MILRFSPEPKVAQFYIVTISFRYQPAFKGDVAKAIFDYSGKHYYFAFGIRRRSRFIVTEYLAPSPIADPLSISPLNCVDSDLPRLLCAAFSVPICRFAVRISLSSASATTAPRFAAIE